MQSKSATHSKSAQTSPIQYTEEEEDNTQPDFNQAVDYSFGGGYGGDDDGDRTADNFFGGVEADVEAEEGQENTNEGEHSENPRRSTRQRTKLKSSTSVSRKQEEGDSTVEEAVEEAEEGRENTSEGQHFQTPRRSTPRGRKKTPVSRSVSHDTIELDETEHSVSRSVSRNTIDSDVEIPIVRRGRSKNSVSGSVSHDTIDSEEVTNVRHGRSEQSVSRDTIDSDVSQPTTPAQTQSIAGELMHAADEKFGRKSSAKSSTKKYFDPVKSSSSCVKYGPDVDVGEMSPTTKRKYRQAMRARHRRLVKKTEARAKEL
jgi:hypothetical protein